MNHLPTPVSPKWRGLAAVLAVSATVLGLTGVDSLAKQRWVSPHAQVVELQRVVVTARRSMATAESPVAVAAASCRFTREATAAPIC